MRATQPVARTSRTCPFASKQNTCETPVLLVDRRVICELSMAKISQQQIYQNALSQRASDKNFEFPTLGAYAEPFAQFATQVLPKDSFLESDLPVDQWRASAHAALMKFLGRMPARPKLT